MPMPTFSLARLGAFRAELHATFTRRADALFELGDALLCAPAVPSLPHLSLAPVCRRGWGRVYAALARGRIDTERLRGLLASHLPDSDPPVFAVDVTTWPGCDAECSPCRGSYDHPSRHPAGRPIIAGWAFQWIGQLSFDRDSWTAPVDAARRHPAHDTDQQAAWQIRALLARLPPAPSRRCWCSTAATTLPSSPWTWPRSGWRCWCGWALTAASMPTHHHACLASRVGRAATGPSSTAPPRPPGRPDRHPDLSGRPVRHRDRHRVGRAASQTATPPGHAPEDATDRARHHPPRPGPAGPRQDGPTEGAVAVVGRPRRARPGPGLAGYVRRFDLEHTVRFAKQTLGWTTPRPRHPEQADRWTWLVLATYAQLRLARQLAGDQRLPWERPRPQRRLSPVRVRRGFPQLLGALGSAAAAPKPAGRSPGRPRGSRSGPASRYPAIKKPTTKPRKKPPTTAAAA
jgi:hypothetical protein